MKKKSHTIKLPNSVSFHTHNVLTFKDLEFNYFMNMDSF